MDLDRPAIDDMDIKRRAYEIYESRGDAAAMALNDWLQAERELIERSFKRRSETRILPSLPDDWHLVHTARVNLLLMGPDDVTRNVVDALGPYLREPVITAHPGEPLALAPMGQVGTMILYDVGAFGLADQRLLLEWLAATAGGTQVVSITSRSLVPLIEAGAFLDTLYYRLNVVCLDVARSGKQRCLTGDGREP